MIVNYVTYLETTNVMNVQSQTQQMKPHVMEHHTKNGVNITTMITTTNIGYTNFE